jgi:flagellar FliJ protein
MLEQYRDEYAQRMREATAEGITRLILRNYQDFLARIDEAIEQQRQAVQNSELSTKAGQTEWRNQNTKLMAIDTLSSRHDARERYRENKQEQKILDEFSSRKYSTPDSTE